MLCRLNLYGCNNSVFSIGFSPSATGFPTDIPKFVSPTQGMSPVNNPSMNVMSMSPTANIVMTGLSPQQNALQKVLASAG